MKYAIHMMSILAVVAFLFCGHYCVASYFKSRQLKAQAETIAVRTRLLKHQVGELEQKVRILNRVQHFVDSAQAHRLTPERWSVYDVQIQDALAYQEMARIVEQCTHNKDLYFKPISLHAAVGQANKLDASPEEAGEMEPVPLAEDADSDGPEDVALALQGSFLVRH